MLNADLVKQALRARSKIMFSGETGAVVASGITDDAAMASQPRTANLCLSSIRGDELAYCCDTCHSKHAQGQLLTAVFSFGTLPRHWMEAESKSREHCFFQTVHAR